MVQSVTEEIPRVQWELAVRDVGQPGKSRYSGQTRQGICLVECGGDMVWGDPVLCSDTWPDLKELKVTYAVRWGRHFSTYSSSRTTLTLTLFF